MEYINYYHNELLKDADSKIAKDYIKQRNLNIDEVKKFKIGFVKKNSSYFNILAKKFDEKTLQDSGLFYFDEKKKVFVERFRDRIIFPINSITGYHIGLGGRITQKNSYLAKYINSPETQFFKKGNNLYNLDKARKLSNSISEIFLLKNSKILNFYTKFKSIISKDIKNKSFALAVSGGSDSLCLAYFSKIYSSQFRNKTHVLIVDHKLRK